MEIMDVMDILLSTLSSGWTLRLAFGLKAGYSPMERVLSNSNSRVNPQRTLHRNVGQGKSQPGLGVKKRSSGGI